MARGRLTRSMLGRVATSSASLSVCCEHVQMVKARSDWFESSWSKRHMLARADFARFRRALQTCPTTAHDANSRIFGVDTFRLDFSCSTAQGGCNVAQLFVASMGQVPKGVCLTTMVPTAAVERTSVDLCASLADSRTSVVVDGSVEVIRALGSKF